MQYRLKHILEYGFLRGFGGLVCLLPLRMALALGWFVAAVAFYVMRWRRNEAERRIREVFGDRYTAPEVTRIAWLSLRNVAFNAVEMIMVSRLNHTWLKTHAEFAAAYPRLKAQIDGGEGALLAVIHMGNWDAAGIGMEQMGIPMLVIARAQTNPLFNAYMNRQRAAHGSMMVDRDDRALIKKVLAWLKAGKAIAILIDLRAKQEAVQLPFLGKQADLGRGIGLIARQSGVPIYPAITIRKGWTHHEWTLCDPIHPDQSLDKKSDSIRMTEACLQVFDRVIREHPDQYFWYNKRWVLEPLPKQGAGGEK